MKVETYLKKFYDVHVEVEQVFVGSKSTTTKIWLEEKNSNGEFEPIGFLLKLSDCETYQWRRIYGPVPTGKAFLGAAAVKAAAASFYQA